MSLFTLDPIQETAVEYAIANPYSIIALDMGLGKTLVALETAFRTKSKTLIVCPSYLKLKWKLDIQKFYPDASISVLDRDSEFYHLWDTDIAIISYYYLPKADILFEWADMVVYEEGHYLKNTKAKRSEAAHKLTYENSISRCLILTGTPIENRVYEFYSLLALCNYDPRIEKSEFLDKFPSYVDFANYFSYLKEFDMWVGDKKVKVQQWEGIRLDRLDELNKYKKGHYIRGENNLNIPFIDIEVPVLYDDNPELLSAFEQFCKDGTLTGVSSDVKAKASLATAPFTADYAKDLIDQGLSVAIFSDHPAAAALIAKKLKTTHIDGGTDMQIRQDQVTEFQNGIRKLIVATTGSLGTGRDLYYAQDLIFNDLPWKPSMEDQVRARTKRRGQLGTCRYHYIYGTMQSHKIRSRLEEKRKTIKVVI